MATSTTDVRTPNYRSISVVELDNLRKEQEQFHEGSFEWADYESKINQIIAENYMRYLNR
jgi:hypothetical protein